MNAMAIFSRITRRHAEKSTLCASLCLMPVTTTLDSYGNKAFRFADLASRGKPRNLLASIHKFGAMTQVELAEVTGLSTATVSTLVHQLVDEDQLETKSTVRNGRRALW